VLTRALKRRARELGADLVGVAPARAFPEAKAYQDWIAAGMQGSMDYMAENHESRLDIRHWYPDARSVLLCGYSYAGKEPQAPRKPGGRVSRYAALPDYHPELKKRMRELLDWLKTNAPGADGRLFVDTSPLLERLYGRYAGLGWTGKNTMLIAPKLGSYFFLAGLAVNVELQADEPAPDHCGSCRKCLEACPTGAFPAERVLDASRCISYFTIEHRGPIPEGFRKGVGDWIMGCDVCQEVCPWNRFASAGPVFSPVMETALDLEELAGLDEAAFRARFRNTPLSRAKRRGLVRNALLAMGNSQDGRFSAVLRSFLADPDPILAEQAAWSLERCVQS
jgi:epoxyqueuosine reductase